MKRIFTIISLLVIFNSGVSAQRGTIVDIIPMATSDPTTIMQNLYLSMDLLNYNLIDAFTYKKHNVNAVKIIYNTIDGQGNETTASGVIFLPAVPEPTEMPVFSYLHGTLTRDIDIPSGLFGIQSIIGWIMAMDGYIAVLPDYIGLGNYPGMYPGIHPFCHSDSEASASIDMLKAAMLFCATYPGNYAVPDGDLYLSGYSQGAHAALATHRELEENPIPGLTLRETVAGSGAYSLSLIQKKFLFDHPEYPNPSFLPYLLLGYQDVYENIYSNLNQVFVKPYNIEMPGFFDGSNDVEDIDSYLPLTWQSMFVPGYLRNIKYRYFHPVNVALRENDLIRWKPETDLHLYYCNCDELVAKENSLLAYLSFLLQGSQKVTCLPLGDFNHNDCAPPVMLLTKIQFDCASGINPCGFDLVFDLAMNKSASETDLSMLDFALSGNNTIDKNLLINNKEISSYIESENEQSELVQIYPNPASDIVNIELLSDFTDLTKIGIFDMQGRLIQDKIFYGNKTELNVKSILTGVYKVVVNNDVSSTKTLVVKR